MKKFGYPESAIAEYDHWTILIRPKQVTLGSMILCEKSDATAFSQVTPESYAELTKATTAIQTALERTWAPDKLNLVALMMVDPHVHFHVIPRYSLVKQFVNVQFSDEGWPRHPDMSKVQDITSEQLESIRRELARALDQR
jgi:diadenosine tetraphosphate (Ap4A) HIT family hydrolase